MDEGGSKVEVSSSYLANEFFDVVAGSLKTRYIYMCNMNTNISKWSKNAVDFFGLPGEYMHDANSIWIQHIHPEDLEDYSSELDAIFSGIKTQFEADYRAMDKDGNYVVCTGRGKVIEDKESGVPYFVGCIINHGIIDNVDPNTNLYNLYEFLFKMQLLREKKQKSIVLMFGIRHFSDVNNMYGYTFGNKVLKTIAKNLLEMAKSNGKVYRMDGTRFAFVTTTMDIEAVSAFYGEIQKMTRHNVCVDGIELAVDICGGVVVADNTKIDEHTIHSCVRYALDCSKNQKHGELVVYSNNNVNDDKKAIELVNALRTSVLEGCRDFYMCYQPVVAADTEKLIGMEALVRWNKEPYGNVSPAVFIPYLETDPVFFELGNWILKEAFTEGRAILDRYPNFIMNVNISYTQLERKDFRKTLMELLESTGFPPQNLCVELTERCRLLNIDFLREEVIFLKSQGIKIALDDFGTGFSSLNLLRELPVDCIKIDRGFVTEIEQNVTDQSIVKAVTQCAKELSIRVCVEGIENEKMKEYMKNYSSTSYQGYYYSRPVRMNEFKQLSLY